MELGSSGPIFLSPKNMSYYILLFLLVRVSNALVGPSFVVAELEGSVNITCQYTTSTVNIHGRKYWCKISRTGCHTLISSTYVSADYKRRARLVDSPLVGTFQVEVVHLKREDSGRYRCGIGENNDGFFFSVFMAVSQGPNTNDQLEVAHRMVRGSITIRCRFNESSIDKMYWCKMERTGNCRVIADTEGYVSQQYIGRILIVSGVNPNLFKILMNQLLEEDAGWYRCGKCTIKNCQTWKDIQIHISKDASLPERPTILHRPQGSSVTIECRDGKQLKNGDMYLCKWKGKECTRLIDNAGFVNEALVGRLSLLAGEENATIFTVLMTGLKEEDAGWYWCVAINGPNDITSSIELRILKESTTVVPMNETAAVSTFLTPISTEQNHSTDHANTVVTFDSHAIRRSCPPPTRFQFGQLQETFMKKNVFPIGTRVTYKCRPGYVIKRNLPRTITCLDTLHWTEIQEFCERKNCGNPGELLNGDIQFQEGSDGHIDTKFGSSVTFTCKPGFRLVGRNTRTCTAGGWNNALPICEVTICSKPPDIPNGRHNSMGEEEFHYQHGVTYNCNSKAFSLIGDASIYCTENGVWSGPAPKCKVISCTSPHVPNAYRIAGFGSSYTFKDSVRLACRSGFVMDGSSLIECGEDNDWHPPLPVCRLPHLLVSTKSTPTSKLPVSFTSHNPTLPDVQVFTAAGERGTTLLRSSTTDAEVSSTVLEKSTQTSKLSEIFTSETSTISDIQVFTAEGERGTTPIRSSTTDAEEVATVSTKSTPKSKLSTSFNKEASTILDVLVFTAEGERGITLFGRSTTDADEAATEVPLFSHANTASTASTTAIFLTDSRGRNESFYQGRTVPVQEKPQPEDPALNPNANSNHTIFKHGWKTSYRNVLLFVVPSLVLAFLLLLGAGAIIVIRARRRWKYKVRQPVSQNGSHVPMAEARYLQTGAGAESPSPSAEEETDIDHDDVSKGLIQKPSFSSFTGDT